jgi:hypothetical protein
MCDKLNINEKSSEDGNKLIELMNLIKVPILYKKYPKVLLKSLSK